MSSKQALINTLDSMPSNIIDEVYHYAIFLKHQADKKSRNSAYVEKIQRGIVQCAEGRGIERDISEVSEYE
jgi:hypothetical protein